MLKILSICIGIGALGATLIAGRHMIPNAPGRAQKTWDLAVSGAGAQTMKLKASVSSVEIETGNSSEVKIHAIRWTKNPESSTGKRWMNDSRLTATRVGNVVEIVDTVGSQQGFHGIQGDLNGNLELHITAPKNLALEVQVGAGTVKPIGEFRSVGVQLGAGSFEGRLSLSGRDASEVHVGAGEVKLSLPRGTSLDVDANTGVGEIKGLPGKAEQKDSVHVGDSRAARFGSGGRSLSVRVGAGSIEVQSPVSAAVLSADRSSEGPRDSRPERILSQDDDGISGDGMGNAIAPAIAQALSESKEAVAESTKQTEPEIDGDLNDVGPEITRALAEALPQVNKALAQVGPDVDRALREAQPEIDKAMKQAQPEIDRELAKIGPEIKRALEAARPQIERAQKERRLRLKQLGPEIEKAMKEAQAEIDKAGRDFDKQSKDHAEMNESVRKAVRDALKAAKEAMAESIKAAKAMNDDVRSFKGPDHS